VPTYFGHEPDETDPGADPEWETKRITISVEFGPEFEATGALFHVLDNDEHIRSRLVKEIKWRKRHLTFRRRVKDDD
jgi:hypothetical protein